ncbi:MAG: Uma2 family endonuclease [Chloroflexota bacterium]
MIETSPTGETQGLITLRLAFLIGGFIYQHNLGRVYGEETGFILSQNPDPDIAFTAKERLAKVIDDFPTVVPDLAVEVVSTGNTKIELQEKVAAYFQAGVRLLWVVYPKSRTVYVYHTDHEVTILAQDAVLTGGSVLADFSVKLSEVFAVLG